MRRYWSWLGLNLGKRAGTVAVVGLLITLGLGLGITRLQFKTSNASYLNGNDQAQIENQHYSSLFGGDPIVTMFSMDQGKTVDQLFTATNIARFQQLETTLQHNPHVFSVVGPLDAATLAQDLVSGPGGIATSVAGKALLQAEQADPSPAGRQARLQDISAELAANAAIPPAQQQLTNPAWVHDLLFSPVTHQLRASVQTFLPNPTHAEMIVFLKGNLSIDQEAAAARSVESEITPFHFQNARMLTTGVPALLNAINSYLKSGMLTLGALAAAIMVLILVLLFNVRWRLLAFGVVAIGLIWAFGLVGFLGIPLTLGSIAGLPVLLGVGIDYAIQMHSRVEEEVVLDRAAHPIQATARNLGPALLVVTFDAVFAFAALFFARVPMIRQFGALLVVGIVMVCIFSIVGPLAFLGIREYKSPTVGKDFSHGRLARLVVWLGSLPAGAAIPFAVVSVAILLGGIAVEGNLQLQTDPIQWVNPHSTAIKDILALKAGTGADNEMGVLVTTDHPFSDATVAFDARLGNDLVGRYPNELYQGAGLVQILDQVLAVPGASEVPPTGAEARQLYQLAPPAIRALTVAQGGRTMNIVFRSRTAVLGSLKPVVDHLQRSVATPPGISVAPGGIAVVGVGLLDNLNASRSLLTYLSILLVAGFLTIRLRSLIRALLSLVPVLIAVGAVSLFAYAFNLKLSPMTSVAGPLVVAACTEFTSLILLRFVEERARGLDPRQAVDVTAARTGRAFIVSALTAVAGVAVMATSSMPLLQGFGTIVAMNVAVALLCALVVLPPVLVWADERNWVSRGLMHPDPDEKPHQPLGGAAVAGAGEAGATPPWWEMRPGDVAASGTATATPHLQVGEQQYPIHRP